MKNVIVGMVLGLASLSTQAAESICQYNETILSGELETETEFEICKVDDHFRYEYLDHKDNSTGGYDVASEHVSIDHEAGWVVFYLPNQTTQFSFPSKGQPKVTIIYTSDGKEQESSLAMKWWTVLTNTEDHDQIGMR